MNSIYIDMSSFNTLIIGYPNNNPFSYFISTLNMN